VKKCLLVIARYKDERQEIFEKYISPKNKDYCFKHGIEYLLIDNSENLELVRGNPTWWKFSILQKLIKGGYFKDGDLFSHFDADMVIVKPEKEYTTNKSFSYAIDNGNTHCMGNYCLKINDWSIDMIDKIMDEEFYQSNKHKKHWQEFREQAAWYSLCGIKPHSWESFLDLPHYGFRSEKEQPSVYDYKQLHTHVEIKTPEWNNTLLSEEADNPISQMLEQYNINKTLAKDCIIRHFAGGQPWRKEYFE